MFHLLIVPLLLVIPGAHSNQRLLFCPFPDENQTTIRLFSSILLKRTLLLIREETDIPKAINVTEVVLKLSVHSCSESNSAGIFVCEADIPNFYVTWVCMLIYFTFLSLQSESSSLVLVNQFSFNFVAELTNQNEFKLHWEMASVTKHLQIISTNVGSSRIFNFIKTIMEHLFDRPFSCITIPATEEYAHLAFSRILG